MIGFMSSPISKLNAVGSGNVSLNNCIGEENSSKCTKSIKQQACYFAGSFPSCLKESKDLNGKDLRDISNLAKIHIENGYSIGKFIF